MKKVLFFALFCMVPSFAFKDVFYLGLGYSVLEGKADISPFLFDSQRFDLPQKTDLAGSAKALRFGHEFNYDKEHIFKNRLEILLEKRDYDLKFLPKIKEKSVKVEFAYLVGINTGLFLTNEFGVFLKHAFGYERLDKSSKSTNQTFGLMVNLAFKNFEIFVASDIECRQRGTYVLIPIDFFTHKKRQETTISHYGGINLRF